MNVERLGRELRRTRENKGLSRRQLAEHAEVSAEVLRDIERGGRSDSEHYEPQPWTLRKVAEGLGYPDGPAWLRLGGLPEMADTLERDLLGSGVDRLRGLTTRQRQLMGEIEALIVELVLLGDNG